MTQTFFLQKLLGQGKFSLEFWYLQNDNLLLDFFFKKFLHMD